MAIVFESFTSGSLDNVTSGTLSLPTGTAANDVLLFVSNCDGVSGLSTLTGFTDLLGGPINNTTGGSHRGGYQYRVCDGTEPSSYSITTVSGGERAAYALLRFSGVDNVSPINASASNPGGSNASVVFPSSMSTTEDDCTIVAGFSIESGNSGNGILSTLPSGWTEVYDNQNGPPGNGNASSSCAAATFTQATAGSVSSETVSIGGGDTRWISVYIALAPGSDTVDDLISAGIETTTEVGSPSVGQNHVLTPIGIQSNSETGSPTVGVINNLTSSSIASLSEVGLPDLTISVGLTADSVGSLTSVGSPTVGIIHNLSADSVQSTSELEDSTLSLSVEYSLSADSIESVSRLSNPILTETLPKTSKYVNTGMKFMGKIKF